MKSSSSGSVPCVRICRVGSAQARVPAYQTPGAAGLDLAADVPEPVRLQPQARQLIPTGLSIELPEGFEGQVRPRSGLALRHGVTVLNSPGTIDCDYRGEIKVLLINLGTEPFVVEPGQRIAQLVVAPVVRVQLTQVESLSDTARGANGYGSTGTG